MRAHARNVKTRSVGAHVHNINNTRARAHTQGRTTRRRTQQAHKTNRQTDTTPTHPNAPHPPKHTLPCTSCHAGEEVNLSSALLGQKFEHATSDASRNKLTCMQGRSLQKLIGDRSQSNNVSPPCNKHNLMTSQAMPNVF